jgi:hypothetical protein
MPMLKTLEVTVRCRSGFTTVLTVEATDAVAACRVAKRVFQAGDDYTPADPFSRWSRRPAGARCTVARCRRWEASCGARGRPEAQPPVRHKVLPLLLLGRFC